MNLSRVLVGLVFAVVIFSVPQAAHALSLTTGASDYYIVKDSGDTVILYWNVTGATQCTASDSNGWSDPNWPTTSGSAEVGMNKTTTYIFSCTNGTNTLSSGQTISVGPDAQLSISPTSLTPGESATLTWSSSPGASCGITDVGDYNPSSGTKTINPTTSKTYYMTCYFWESGMLVGQSRTVSVSVTVAAGQGCNSILSGTTVSWLTNCGTTEYLNVPSGTSQIFTNNKANYTGQATYTCQNGAWVGPTNASCIADAQPTIVSFTADPSSMGPGWGSHYLYWTLQNVHHCKASGAWTGNNIGGNSSQTIRTIDTTSTYTLECFNQDESLSSGSKTVVVTVGGTCTPTNAACASAICPNQTCWDGCNYISGTKTSGCTGGGGEGDVGCCGTNCSGTCRVVTEGCSARGELPETGGVACTAAWVCCKPAGGGGCTPSVPSCTAANTCTGSTCWNGCSTISGTKSCPGGCTPSVPSCTAANTCAGTTCSDGCNTITGIKNCSTCIPNLTCASNTCIGLTCSDGCGGYAQGTMDCPTGSGGGGIIPCGLTNDDPNQPGDQRVKCTLCHLVVGINAIVKLLRNIMTAVAIAVIVAMSFVYITSAGDEGRMRMAKGGIVAALIGFAVILLAWVAVNFIMTLPIFSASGLVKTGWDSVTCNTKSNSLP